MKNAIKITIAVLMTLILTTGIITPTPDIGGGTDQIIRAISESVGYEYVEIDKTPDRISTDGENYLITDTDAQNAFGVEQVAVKQVADDTFDIGGNLYNILDGYIVEHLYVRTSDSRYQFNGNYTLIVIPVKVASGNMLRFRAFDEGVFSSADFHAAVATSYPVVGESANALCSVAGSTHRGGADGFLDRR